MKSKPIVRLQCLDLLAGDTLHLVSGEPRLVLSKPPLIPDRIYALVAEWERE